MRRPAYFMLYLKNMDIYKLKVVFCWCSGSSSFCMFFFPGYSKTIYIHFCSISKMSSFPLFGSEGIEVVNDKLLNASFGSL